MKFDPKQALEAINLSGNQAVEWIGLREVQETDTNRYIRDGKPQSNSRSHTHGVMVEVLANGQFGYASTNCLDQPSI